MQILEGIQSRLSSDAALVALTPGGIWTGTAPAADAAGPIEDRPGAYPGNYVTVTPIPWTVSRSSTAYIEAQAVQFSAWAFDRGEGVDVLLAVRQIIRRIRELIEDRDFSLTFDGGTLIGAAVSVVNFVPQEDLSWMGQLDMVFRVERARSLA